MIHSFKATSSCAIITLLVLLSGVLASGCAFPPPERGMFISRAELDAIPASGHAWDSMKQWADQPISEWGSAELTDQNSEYNISILAAALVAARLAGHDNTLADAYRRKVADALDALYVDPDERSLGISRNIAAVVVAADLINFRAFDAQKEQRFRERIDQWRHQVFSGRSVISTHDDRPNNWGTMAGASRVAAAIYLGDTDDLEAAATVWKGWLGDRSAYDSFTWYGAPDNLSWQADPERPVGINPAGAMRDGNLFDGMIPDDFRRHEVLYDGTNYPAHRTGYVTHTLGPIAIAIELLRRNYDPNAHNWQDRAPARAVDFLRHITDHPNNPATDGKAWSWFDADYESDEWQVDLWHFLYPDRKEAWPGYEKPEALRLHHWFWTDFTHRGRSVEDD